MAANTTYEFEAFVVFTVGANNNVDFKYTFTGSVGAPTAIFWSSNHQVAAAVVDLTTVTASGTTVTADVSSGSTGVARIRGFVQNGASAQNLKFQWSAAGSTQGVTVKTNSFLKVGSL